MNLRREYINASKIPIKDKVTYIVELIEAWFNLMRNNLKVV